MKRTFACLLLSLIVLALTSLSAAAAKGTKDGVMTINGGGQTVLMKAPHVVPGVHPAVHEPSLKKIYSNLGSGGTYNGSTGWTISGVDSLVGVEWTQGSAFTPTKNAVATRIKVAFTYVTGTNAGTVSLYNDKGGVPGKVLHKFKDVTNLPTFGDTDSTLQTVNFKKGVSLKKGKQYWVVLSSPDDTWDVWNLANTATGNEAYNNGNGWTLRQTNLGAFAVQGP